jgi:hypothetical protein
VRTSPWERRNDNIPYRNHRLEPDADLNQIGSESWILPETTEGDHRDHLGASIR